MIKRILPQRRNGFNYLQQMKQVQKKGGSRVKEPRGTDSARVVSVIETQALRGTGTEEDKCRIVTQYWDFEGNLLAENDPCAKEKE